MLVARSQILFTYKTCILFLSPFIPENLGCRLICNFKAPPKVKVFSWIIAKGRVNAADMLQRRRLNPYREGEGRLFFHCKVVGGLCSGLFGVGALIVCGLGRQIFVGNRLQKSGLIQ